MPADRPDFEAIYAAHGRPPDLQDADYRRALVASIAIRDAKRSPLSKHEAEHARTCTGCSVKYRRHKGNITADHLGPTDVSEAERATRRQITRTWCEGKCHHP